MKFVFLLGGLVGFLVAGLTDFLSDRNPGRVFFDAAVGCLVGGMLAKWFWNVLLRGVQETYVARHKAAVAAAAAAAAVAAVAAPAVPASPGALATPGLNPKPRT